MTMQSDSQVRVVALSNLYAMCTRLSGVCHRFTVTRIAANRASVEYSNPDEYGNEHPMTAVYPSWTVKGEGTYVALNLIAVLRDVWDGEGWQAFTPLIDCPELFRTNPDSETWYSRAEWEVLQPKPYHA